MACDMARAKRIAQSGVAKIVGPMLVDQNAIVRTSGASTLRSIADNGQTEAQTSLLNDDIMTPLCSLLKDVSIKNIPRFIVTVMARINNLFATCSAIQIGNQIIVKTGRPKRLMKKRHLSKQSLCYGHCANTTSQL